ncbi:hypothetical protein [Nocardiopsis chromatogenes]|uniref:hypothetical protein n=1 Tax=Nocardiopsis chromatogenes TaxID=280239 RepID=UPI00034698E2|nr:hypothetical protein [Nocardiopsis chromatogenes]
MGSAVDGAAPAPAGRDLESGRAEASAWLLLKILRHRGITVEGRARERIVSCTDVETLDAWGDLALRVSSPEELFA